MAEFPASSRVMSATAAQPETCGNCRWGRRVDQVVGPEAGVECNGVPPSPVVVGADHMGQAQVALLRPKQPAKTPRCGLWGPAARLLS